MARTEAYYSLFRLYCDDNISCDECPLVHQDMYKCTNASFIIDDEDTVAAYEARGKARKAQVGAGPTQYEMGMEALSSLDRVQQMEAILSKSFLNFFSPKFVLLNKSLLKCVL